MKPTFFTLFATLEMLLQLSVDRVPPLLTTEQLVERLTLQLKTVPHNCEMVCALQVEQQLT